MKRYLLDTNILIYYLADAVPPERVNGIEDMLTSSFCTVENLHDEKL
jgi:predicted nucleic acid-binding protein